MSEKKLAYGTRVIVDKVGSLSPVNGKVGTVVGISTMGYVSMYIVRFDEVMTHKGNDATLYRFDSLVLPDCCLRLIDTEVTATTP